MTAVGDLVHRALWSPRHHRRCRWLLRGDRRGALSPGGGRHEGSDRRDLQQRGPDERQAGPGGTSGPCGAVLPAWLRPSSSHGQWARDNLSIVGMNIDENPGTPRTYGIMQVPTMNVYQTGQVVKQIVGTKPKAALPERPSPSSSDLHHEGVSSTSPNPFAFPPRGGWRCSSAPPASRAGPAYPVTARVCVPAACSRCRVTSTELNSKSAVVVGWARSVCAASSRPGAWTTSGR